MELEKGMTPIPNDDPKLMPRAVDIRTRLHPTRTLSNNGIISQGALRMLTKVRLMGVTENYNGS